MASNRVIGKDGGLPWHIPGELKWFKELTIGHAIVMGRKTFDSIGRPLPGRRNIVLSQNLHQGDISGVEIVNSIDELENLDNLVGEVFVIGGTRVFEALLHQTRKIYLTYIHQPYDGDAVFPEFEGDFPAMTLLRSQPDYEIRLYQRRA
jgi:dihydrofolate reductase